MYGVFGVVLGLLAWLYLQAQFTLYAVEANVVSALRLWPRSLAPPPLTAQDRRAYEMYAQIQERRPEQEIESRITEEPDGTAKDGASQRQRPKDGAAKDSASQDGATRQRQHAKRQQSTGRSSRRPSGEPLPLRADGVLRVAGRRQARLEDAEPGQRGGRHQGRAGHQPRPGSGPPAPPRPARPR